ncbi:glycosyltransferase [Geobacter sp. AOG1]|uniref:glycosyltransferase n=1 Tax=Geobacter sp. AOG1 TaxID=1566346 RepID=UPI001CC78C13|nr:glycosyltransferase [Geobacter sp. AOG1]
MSSKTLKITYVDESLAIGGAEEYLKMLLKEFSGIFETTLIHRNSRHHNGFYADLKMAKVALDPAVYDKPVSLFKSYFTIFKSDRGDLLHVNLPAPNYCRSAIIAASMCRIRGVVTTSHLPNLTFPRSKLGMLAGRSIWDWIVWRMVFDIIDTSIVVSEASADSLKANYPTSPDRVRCIHNGVDQTRFAGVERIDVENVKQEFGISANDLVVASVGRLHPQKGYTYLLNAMLKLNRNIPNVKLILVGDGPLRADLGRLAVDLGLKDKVIFAGKRDDIPQLLAASDIYVNSSLFEGLPFSILEAMSAGVPVVATAVDGNKEIIYDPGSGILVPAEDAEGLANAISILANDSNRRRTLGMQGRDVVTKIFSIDLMLQKTEQLYREVAARYKR